MIAIEVSPDGFGRATPGFDQPLEMLAACHTRMEGELQTLERLAGDLAPSAGDEQARDAARAVLRCFDTDGRNHHLDEDENLFPEVRALAALRGRPEVAATLYELECEHEALDGLYSSLRSCLEDITEGRPARLDAERVAHFAWTYRRHMALEARVVLPFAAESLSEAQKSALGASMEARRAA
jgi:hemerythrin-like domain-containing protein